MSQQPRFLISSVSKTITSLSLEGVFEVDHWFLLKDQLPLLKLETKNITLNFKNLVSLDTFGAWQLARLWQRFEDEKKTVTFENCSPEIRESIEDMKGFSIPSSIAKELDGQQQNPVAALGEKVVAVSKQFARVISFLGSVIIAIGGCIRHPSTFRFKSFIKYLDYTGVRAIPIITLVSLLIGVVLVYQGVSQLERFGAEIFTVNLLAVSILRELGILMTAIVIAGRSGSAFTAQIGFMKLNQELDAMKVLGLEPMQLLVVPRVLALMVVLPLLTVFCDLVAITGGAFMSVHLIDLSLSQFLTQLQSAISPSTFWVGMVKAPVFAFVIALIACYEGLRVSGGAESVGRRTTNSVVKSIFMVIVLNAIFSVVFSILKI